MREKYFDIERDKQFSCWCQACLVGKSESQMSQRDTRYCLECQPFIKAEYAMIAQLHGRKTRYDPIAHIQLPIAKEEEVLLHTKTVASHAYQNPTEDRRIVNLGGRPKRDVPIELIHKFSKEGLSIGKIVKELKAQGQTISAMTVSRVLSGERN